MHNFCKKNCETSVTEYKVNNMSGKDIHTSVYICDVMSGNLKASGNILKKIGFFFCEKHSEYVEDQNKRQILTKNL